MSSRPPVQPARQTLPFLDPAFGWDTFEDFFCDFLNAQPVITLNDVGTEIRRRVIRARPFGRKGDSQHGIDLLAEMEGGEVWDFQCKHYKTAWTPKDTREAIEDYKRDATRRFLLITRDVSEVCHEVIAEHPGWALWDAREINRRFRELQTFKSAPILFTHFGPHWAEAFFGLPGDGPLLGADAKYAPNLRAGRRFHHRHALIGRENLLDQLDAFVRDDVARVFILTGRGGLGKSRLLLHWSREFHRRHPGHTLRFLSDKCADFGPALQTAPQPLTLVFDDAHRFDDVRRSLFHELPHRTGIRLVLSLRPGPIGQVMQELLGAGFDTTEVTNPGPMKPLTSTQTMELVDAALKPKFSKYRHFLRAASHDCPLVAVVGAELINTEALTGSDLLDANELQRLVFESLLDDARAVRHAFGAEATDDFLRLLALLGPVKLDDAFFAKAAPFIGVPHADRVSHLRDALDDAGLLHTTGAGTRITPDLLSDHLAYTACYDRAGRNRGFANRLLSHFSVDEFPKLMQHLAEAEWRALDEQSDTESIVEPLWQWFRARFERSSFYDRQTQLGEWANIAHLQPARSLALAELALSLTTAPPPDNTWLIEGRWDSHEHTLSGLPSMLVGVAENHPEHIASCFDLLWQLGRDKPVGSFHNDQSHPISVIGEVVTYKHWKSLEIQEAALAWFERLLTGDDWQRHLHKPGWLLGKFFEPMFATSVGENWSTGRTFHMRSHLLNLHGTARLRDRILALCRRLLATGDAQLASQLIPILERGCDVARLGNLQSPPLDFVAKWDIERHKALSVLEEITRDFPEPLLHFQIRRALMRDLRYGKDSPAFRDSCRRIITGIPDTLDLRIARAAFGSYYDEFERDTDRSGRDWQLEAKARWETFIRETAVSVRETYAAAWLPHLSGLDTRWRGFDSFTPNFRHLLITLAERYPAEGIAAAESLLANPTLPLAHAFDALAMSATKADAPNRFRLIRAAASASSESLNAAAVACCAWWRREESLPEEAWQILESLAPTAPPLVADRMVNFIWWNDAMATARDWSLLTSLPFPPEQTALASNIAERAADLISHEQVKPDAATVGRFLRRFESLVAPEGHDIQHAFEKLAEAFPVETFLMLWRRNEARKSGDNSLKALPYDFGRIRFPRIAESPEVKALLADFEGRLTMGAALDFDEKRLLRSAIQHGDNPSAWLEAAVSLAATEDQLNTLRELGSVGRLDNAAIAYPNFARVLLTRCRAISLECHDRVFSRLMHVGGVRGSTNGEPDDEWKSILEAIERLAHQHADDAELGPLFAKMAKHERSWIEDNRRDRAWDEED